MAMSTFQSIKHEIVHFASLSKDALHIYVGIAVFLLAAAMVKKGARSAVPLLAVFAVALLGEMLDFRDEIRRYGHLLVRASLHDILNTMFWPFMLWLLSRYTKVLK
jgi:uncharacterized membrane protein YqgA involved in biofilm formation